MKRFLKQKVKNRFGPFPAYLDHLKIKGNHKKHILQYNLKHTEDYSPFPLYAKIEINGTCNLDCVMCLRTSLDNREEIMSKENFIKILDNLPQLIEWSPHGYNEPLLHPEFFDFIKETNDRNISLYLVTNATILNKKNSDKLMKLNPRIVRISIDAVGKEYEKIRKGASYEKVLENITYLSKNYQNVSLYATIWKNNFNQIRPLKELADSLNLKITFNDITYKNEYGSSRKVNSIRENFENFYETIDVLLDETTIKVCQPLKRKCSLPWNSIYVDVIGDCFPCTDTLNFKMGDLLKNNIKEIYNNLTQYQLFRKHSLKGNISECKNCLSWSQNYK